jgi:ppGpp synthetase/RelA/SpoT-type nucleotidyltranferase
MEKKCSEFLNRYNISEEAYAATGIVWDELEEVRDHYIQTRDELEPTARYIVNILNKTEKVHSVSYRIKAPEHLIAKIIRKRIGKPEGIINLANYTQKITDLIGIRVLHLFKEDWLDLHQFITRTWNLRKEPIAYVRRGDAAGYINSFKNWGCTIKENTLTAIDPFITSCSP